MKTPKKPTTTSSKTRASAANTGSAKVFDVRRPGTTPAAPTSKPVIISKAPPLDPAMTVDGVSERTADTDRPALMGHRRIEIKPLSDDLAAAKPEVKTAAPDPAPAPEPPAADKAPEPEPEHSALPPMPAITGEPEPEAKTEAKPESEAPAEPEAAPEPETPKAEAVESEPGPSSESEPTEKSEPAPEEPEAKPEANDAEAPEQPASAEATDEKAPTPAAENDAEIPEADESAAPDAEGAPAEADAPGAPAAADAPAPPTDKQPVVTEQAPTNQVVEPEFSLIPRRSAGRSIWEAFTLLIVILLLAALIIDVLLDTRLVQWQGLPHTNIFPH